MKASIQQGSVPPLLYFTELLPALYMCMTLSPENSLHVPHDLALDKATRDKDREGTAEGKQRPHVAGGWGALGSWCAEAEQWGRMIKPGLESPAAGINDSRHKTTQEDCEEQLFPSTSSKVDSGEAGEGHRIVNLA